MENNKLSIVQIGPKEGAAPLAPPTRAIRRQEIEARMQTLWVTRPELFDAERDSVERKRISDTFRAIQEIQDLRSVHAADIGCGSGTLTRLLRDAGAEVDAVDAASNALDRLRLHPMDRIRPIHDCLPMTRLADNAYDLVICTEVLGYLLPSEYRLAMAELSRIVKRDGFVVCSTMIDTDSDNALERFASLAETEFEPLRWMLSYDLLWVKLCGFFEAPRLYYRASRNDQMKKDELSRRRSIGRGWFRLQSSRLLGVAWGAVACLTSPIAAFCRQNKALAAFLAKITQFLWSESGITHATFIGKRRQMVFPLSKDEIPREMKHKRQVWE